MPRSSDVTSVPLTRERHAEAMVELKRHNPRAFMAIFHPQCYVYDERDNEYGWSLDRTCAELRVAIQQARFWREMIRNIGDLLRFDARRRRISIGIDIGTHIVYGETIE